MNLLERLNKEVEIQQAQKQKKEKMIKTNTEILKAIPYFRVGFDVYEVVNKIADLTPEEFEKVTNVNSKYLWKLEDLSTINIDKKNSITDLYCVNQEYRHVFDDDITTRVEVSCISKQNKKNLKVCLIDDGNNKIRQPQKTSNYSLGQKFKEEFIDGVIDNKHFKKEHHEYQPMLAGLLKASLENNDLITAQKILNTSKELAETKYATRKLDQYFAKK